MNYEMIHAVSFQWTSSLESIVNHDKHKQSKNKVHVKSTEDNHIKRKNSTAKDHTKFQFKSSIKRIFHSRTYNKVYQYSLAIQPSILFTYFYHKKCWSSVLKPYFQTYQLNLIFKNQTT